MATPVSNSVALPAIIGGDGTLTDEYINGLVQGSSWQFGAGPRTLTYSFNLNDGQGGPISTSLIDAINRALAEWSNVANISFQNIVSGSLYYQSQADIAFTPTGNELQLDLGAVALAFFPDPAFANALREAAGITAAEYPNPEGDVFLDNFYTGLNVFNVNPGGAGFAIILHETGHALGLKHPDDDGGNGKPTFARLGIVALDAERWTIMSGNANSGSTLTQGNAASPMPLDVLAIQQIYGANMSYHAGDDYYGDTASFFNTPGNFSPIYSTGISNKTLWDAGGNDTIDIQAAGGFSSGVTIDLRPGIGYVDAHFPQNSRLTAIAYGVIIENALGTARNDTIVGNDAANMLDGRFGQDTMVGGLGNDTFVVSEAGDVIVENAGEGLDSVLNKGSFLYALGANIENLTLDAAAGVSGGRGNSGSNVIVGNVSANLLDGAGGADTLIGGLGDPNRD